jgi:hypothetical protein
MLRADRREVDEAGVFWIDRRQQVIEQRPLIEVAILGVGLGGEQLLGEA